MLLATSDNSYCWLPCPTCSWTLLNGAFTQEQMTRRLRKKTLKQPVVAEYSGLYSSGPHSLVFSKHLSLYCGFRRTCFVCSVVMDTTQSRPIYAPTSCWYCCCCLFAIVGVRCLSLARKRCKGLQDCVCALCCVLATCVCIVLC